MQIKIPYRRKRERNGPWGSNRNHTLPNVSWMTTNSSCMPGEALKNSKAFDCSVRNDSWIPASRNNVHKYCENGRIAIRQLLFSKHISPGTLQAHKVSVPVSTVAYDWNFAFDTELNSITPKHRSPAHHSNVNTTSFYNIQQITS